MIAQLQCGSRSSDTQETKTVIDVDVSLSQGTVPYNIFKSLYLSMQSGASEGNVQYMGKQTKVYMHWQSTNTVGMCQLGNASPKYYKTQTVEEVSLYNPKRKQLSVQCGLKVFKAQQQPELCAPTKVEVCEEWSFVHIPFTFTLRKWCEGKTKEDACKQTPTFAIHMELQRADGNPSATDIKQCVLDNILMLCGTHQDDKHPCLLEQD